MLRTFLLAAAWILALPAFAQPADVPGFERTRWGMASLELDAAMGRPLQVELAAGTWRYRLPSYEFAGASLPVEFVVTPGRGLTAVHVGGAFGDVAREREAGVIERTLRNAYGPNPVVRTWTDTNRREGREMERELEWRFPSTLIVYQRYFRSSPDGTVTDLLAVTFVQRP